MRGLGLGRAWVVACPFCRCYHVHAPEEGSRPAHCHGSPSGLDLYALRYEGELPRGLWERFHLSVLEEKPKLLCPPHRSRVAAVRSRLREKSTSNRGSLPKAAFSTRLCPTPQILGWPPRPTSKKFAAPARRPTIAFGCEYPPTFIAVWSAVL